MTSGFEPFMRAIVDQPDDDAIRLVAADWLDEHGEPERAEFIRVQCELAKCPPEVRADRRWSDLRYAVREPWDALRRRERELYAVAVEQNWPMQFPRGVVDSRWTRGFQSFVACDWPTWQTHAAALLAACPIANAKDGCVRLTTMPPVAAVSWVVRDQNGPVIEWFDRARPGVRLELPATALADAVDAARRSLARLPPQSPSLPLPPPPAAGYTCNG